jgi:thiosulfate/3-mercaptopyruvate sulfurtransferase
MPHTTLVSTDTLAAHLGEPGYVIIDCRFALADRGWGEEQYRAAHIPGAAYAHLDRDLSGVKTGTNGRHPLPDPTAFIATLGRLGVTAAAQVVAYDQDNGMFASRLWWLLRWMGHDAVAVLDGGLAKWLREERPTTAGVETPAPAAFSGSPRQEMIVDASAVAGRSRATTLLDARAPERFRGETEPLDRVPGHIPGARNHFFQENIDAHGTFRSPDDVRARIRAAVGDAAPGDIICYCGSGVTACQNLLAMEHAGLTGAKLYPGSWSEWCSDEGREVETGGASR